MHHSFNHKGSALIVALVIMTLLTMMSTVFYEKVYRFSQRSEGIENSNVAYYKAIGTIEQALYTG
jgi:type II secretory pathway component PulK